MAAENVLAREIVQVATAGVTEAGAQIDGLKGKLGGLGPAAAQARAFAQRMGSALVTAVSGPSRLFGAVSRGFRQMNETMQRVAGVARVVGGAGAIGIGGLLAGAVRGTVEADRLGQAWERFSRTIGDGFAPYVRAATTAIEDLTAWFRNLDQATKDNVTQWALITAGVAGFVAFLPVMIAGISGVAGVLAALTSPFALVVGGIALVVAAAAKMFGLFDTGGTSAADSLNESNQSWLGAMVKGVGAATKAVAGFFNFIAQQGAKISDFLADLLARAGEFSGLLPEGTVKELRKMPPIQAPQIDVGAIDEFFGHAERKAKSFEGQMGDLVAQANNLGKNIGRRIEAAKADGGFKIKMDVQFESLGGTWDRLQKALASREGANLDQKQLLTQEQMRDQLQLAVAGLGRVEDKLPAK